MSSIKVYMKDGSIRDFKHEGRSGGSYTKKAIYEGSFLIIEDEWYRRTAIPVHDIMQVVEEPVRW